MTLRDRPLPLAEFARKDLPLPRQRERSFRFRPHLLPGIALMAILLLGLASSCYALLTRSAPLPSQFSWRALIEGEATAAIAGFLQKQNPFGDTLVAADRVINWITVGDLGARVRQGCPGWLFLADELTIHPGRRAALTERVEIVARAAEFLAARNIALVVAPIPDKSRVEAQHLCGLIRSPALAGRLDDFAAGLGRRGVKTVDLLGPLRALDGERYYRSDTHWNERGAQRVAESVAASVRGWGLAPAQQAEFRVKTAPEQERVGDLIRLAGLDGVPRKLRPAGDSETATTIEQSAKGDVGLLDDTPPPEAVLLGTSYSRRANFGGFLAMALGSPVENKAQDGGELTSAAVAYFDSAAFAQTPPRLVIWEIPERFLEPPVPPADRSWADKLAASRYPK